MRSCTSKTERASFPAKRPLYYYITDRTQLRGISLARAIGTAVRWGVNFIQIREKDLADGALYELVCRAVELARGTECRILVNGRPDIAVAAGAHGVHLPSTGLEIKDVRAIFPRDLIVGVSVHTLSEIRRACEQNPDYILMGHVFPTPSKEGLGAPVGLKRLKKACSESLVPVFALGGITPDLIRPVLDAGAAGVAGIRLFQGSQTDRLRIMRPRY